MFIDIYTELVKPINKRNGTARGKDDIWEKIARAIPQAAEVESMTIPRLRKFPNAAKPMVPTVAPTPINISKMPSPSD